MKPIATDTYSFERIITDNKMYVDKTAIIHRLVNKDSGYEFFMSRPRRFGKSLLVSTLKAIFEGRRELFKGLAIDSMDYDWKVYPVLHFDMTAIKDLEPEYMRENLKGMIKARAEGMDGCRFTPGLGAGLWLNELIRNCAEQSPEKKVVVLIDEYDAPVTGLLKYPKKLDAVRDALHDFYCALKANDEHIRFLFMTGVSKFTKLSVFSGLNNLRDISMDAEFATLLGFTPEELMSYHREHIQAFADKKGISFGAMVDELRAWYNGYRFSPKCKEKVLNPVSVGAALRDRELRGHWSMTGASSIIIERIRANGGLPAELNDLVVEIDDLDVCDAVTLPMEALLYQVGYLTIKDVRPSGMLKLGIPNYEVRKALDSEYARAVLSAPPAYGAYANEARYSLAAGDTASVFASLTALYAKIPAEWRVKDEAEVKRFFLLFFSLAGADIITEAQSARGRADAVVTTADAVYVIEFKYGQSSEAALAQIREKGYARLLEHPSGEPTARLPSETQAFLRRISPFADSGKKIVCIGVNFNPETRTLDAPVMG